MRFRGENIMEKPVFKRKIYNDMFCDKFSSRIRDKFVIRIKDYKWENGIHYVPVYMVPFL